MGFTSISEDSSEISFLLVENYNYDHSLWSSDRMGIFGTFHLFIAQLSYMDDREEEMDYYFEDQYSARMVAWGGRSLCVAD